MSKQITFVIGKEGDVRIAGVEGYGSGCLDATRLIEERLGGVDNSSRELTEEYNEPLENDSEGQIEI
jgi:hypothetical protein